MAGVSRHFLSCFPVTGLYIKYSRKAQENGVAGLFQILVRVAVLAVAGSTITNAASPGGSGPALSAQSVVVYDQFSGETLLSRHARLQTPIASITKLMTAVVTLDAGLDLNERIAILPGDAVHQTGAGSRLAVGSRHTREQLLNLALIPSENRAAHALGRTYPGGMSAFVAAMNRKARQLGMNQTRYVEPTGLSSTNQSTAEDLVRLVDYAYSNYADIRHISSRGGYHARQPDAAAKPHRARGYQLTAFNNTNRLTRNDEWQIGLSKTGYISSAGHCLVMQAEIARRPVIIVLLDAQGSQRRLDDANRIKLWLENDVPPPSAPPAKTARPESPTLSCTLSPCQ